MSETITAAEYQRLTNKSLPRPRTAAQIAAHRIILTPLDGEAVERGALELRTVPPSLNNAFLNIKKGRTKSPVYRQWIASAQRDLRKQSGWHVPGKIAVRLFIRKGE